MKKVYLFIIMAFLCAEHSLAQKINLEKWVKHQRDSLIRNGIDTIIYYHHYCGECSVKVKGDDKPNCEVIDNSWTLIESFLIYKQNGNAFAIKFNYCKPPIKTKLISCKSTPYFLSIIPILHKRDKVYAQMRKQVKFFPPIPTDGSYEEATLYCHKSRSNVSLSEYQKNEGYKYWKSYFWIDEEIKLITLIEQDLK
jgi:hypothetical protein